MPRLIEDGFDAALFYGDLLPKEMIAVPLGAQQRYLVVGAPAYLAAGASPAPERAEPARLHRLSPHAHHHYRWAFAADDKLLEMR